MDSAKPVYVDRQLITNARITFNTLRFRRTNTSLPVSRGRIVVHKPGPADHHGTYALTTALKYQPDKKKKIIQEILKNYSDNVVVNSCAERYALAPLDSTALDNAPPWLIIYPWSNYDIATGIEIKNQNNLKENRLEGLDLDAYSGGTAFPLVNNAKIELEADRMLRILESLQTHGYQPEVFNAGDIGAVLLINEHGEWAWHISGGYHRLSALAALDYKTVPVTIKQVIYRSQVTNWPNVKSGVFSKQAALKVFDQILYGKGFPAHNQWLRDITPKYMLN